jgi:hypothetical protein
MGFVDHSIRFIRQKTCYGSDGENSLKNLSGNYKFWWFNVLTPKVKLFWD